MFFLYFLREKIQNFPFSSQSSLQGPFYFCLFIPPGFGSAHSMRIRHRIQEASKNEELRVSGIRTFFDCMDPDLTKKFSNRNSFHEEISQVRILIFCFRSEKREGSESARLVIKSVPHVLPDNAKSCFHHILY